MKYAKHISAVVAVVSLCAWYGVGASKSSAPVDDNPVVLAKQATGVSFMAKVEKIPGGEINWTRGVVRAVGVGKARADLSGRQAELMAKRGAYIIAARNTALVLAGIRVGPGGRFQNVRNGWIRADVTLSGFREVSATYDPATRTATAEMEIPLCGVRGAVNVLGLEGQKPHRSQWNWPKVSSEGKPYDVIVIDARGLPCKPGVLPQIVTMDGHGVFDTSETLTKGTLEHPAVRYVMLLRDTKIPRQAEKNRRRCLTIKATRIDKNDAIMLDKTNLEILSRAPEAHKTLRQGKLLIVTSE